MAGNHAVFVNSRTSNPMQSECEAPGFPSYITCTGASNEDCRKTDRRIEISSNLHTHRNKTVFVICTQCTHPTPSEIDCDTGIHCPLDEVDYSVDSELCPTPTPTPTPHNQRCPPEVCEEGFVQSPYPDCICQPISPIVFDVNGDGLNLTDGRSGVAFDFNGDGILDRMSWTAAGSDDAWLTLDRNNNGIVDSGLELFGNLAPQPSPPPGEQRNGFLALAEYDKPVNGGNGDGMLKQSDTVFSSLRLWQDTNHNGISEPSELHVLTELGILAIDLNYRESQRTDEWGNKFRYRSKLYDSRWASTGRWAWDVFLVEP